MKLNEAVKRENFMLPNLDDVSLKLAGAKCFSILDATSEFYQVPLNEGSRNNVSAGDFST